MWPFEGRQQELALLRSAFTAGDVDTVLVSASAGVGKTRLAREAIAGLGAQHTAWAAATRAAAAIPFAAVAPLLPDAAAHLLDDASAALVAHLARERLAFVVMNVRVGEPVADALLRLVRDNAYDLEEVARRLHGRGYDLLAAELYCAAGRRHRRYQRWADCDLARARAIQLSAAFPHAQTPLLQPGDLITLLTFRERQILLLAAEHTSADIAGRLRLAVATVNNNLARAYHKLGISGRSQLRELLEDPASAGVGGPPNVTA